VAGRVFSSCRKLVISCASTQDVSCAPQAMGAAEREGPVQGRLYRSLKLWTFYCDLEESLGTPESTRAAYDRIIELRIATPQIILNYAAFLQVQSHSIDMQYQHAMLKYSAIMQHDHATPTCMQHACIHTSSCYTPCHG